MPRSIATLTLPVVTALPASAVAGQQVLYAGLPWSFDGAAWSQVGETGFAIDAGTATVDVGAVPVPEFRTVISDPRATLGSKVVGWISATAPGKDADEPEMDVIDVWCQVITGGQINVRLTGQTGFIADAFNVDYVIVKG